MTATADRVSAEKFDDHGHLATLGFFVKVSGKLG
jgi:hypothetical protein